MEKEIFSHYGIGHFIGEPDNPTEFELTRFEEMGELDIDDPHKHTFYEIIWVDEARDHAERLAVTAHHLNPVARQVTGRTTTQLIRARNMLEGKRLFRFTDDSVSEIAATLGYFDLSYFAKVFRADAGISPLEFRIAMSENYRKGSQSF